MVWNEMAAGFLRYVGECASEAPNAFRRGMLLATILANIVFAATLYLGWHLSAFTTFQIWTAAIAIAILEIILILPYRLWKANVAEIERLKAIDYSGPDWTIRELFYHIMPEGLTMVDNHEKVGLDVMDKLSTQQLLAWGRCDRGRPLELIGFDFWSRSRFTYWFLADDHDEQEHAVSNNIMTPNDTFRDIRVNKGTALRLWRK
jgi:hypothetical protein